jgi:hypothetical protein
MHWSEGAKGTIAELASLSELQLASNQNSMQILLVQRAVIIDVLRVFASSSLGSGAIKTKHHLVASDFMPTRPERSGSERSQCSHNSAL